MFDLFGEIDDSILDEIGSDKQSAAAAIAYKTSARIAARRAKAEATLRDILPADIADGDAWHILSSGDVDSLSFLAHILAATQLDYCLFSTWCMAMPDVEQFSAWLESGRIRRLDAYVGEIFPNQYTDEHAALVALLRRHGVRVAVFRNHSKIYACRAGNRAWVIESSANINTNPRTENTVITADMGLYQHHKAYFDGVKSFNRDFDDWAAALNG